MLAMFRLLPRRRPAPAPKALLACPQCGADGLCPMQWETFGDDHWFMWLRCGECGTWLEALVGNRTAAAMDVQLDRQQAAIAAQAEAFEAERMAVEVETLITALNRDLVDASDFAW
jgi:uncharacterized Zn finger protein